MLDSQTVLLLYWSLKLALPSNVIMGLEFLHLPIAAEEIWLQYDAALQSRFSQSGEHVYMWWDREGGCLYLG